MNNNKFYTEKGMHYIDNNNSCWVRTLLNKIMNSKKIHPENKVLKVNPKLSTLKSPQ